jgi:hypothetical protein
MKSAKSIATAVFVAATLAIAGSASAGSGNRQAGPAHSSGMRIQSSLGQRNRRFFRQNLSAFPYYGYGYGNQVYLNPDEADWAEQWRSLSEDNDGPYARSAFEGNPQGKARMWEFPEDGSATKPNR